MYDGTDTWNYAYDFLDQLTTIKKNGAVQSKYWYDAQGRRVRLWNTQDGYVNHAYSGLNIIFENSSAGVVTKHLYTD